MAQPSAPRKIVSVEGITEYRLENGLTVLMFPDAARQTVTVNVTYLVGSRHEGYGETGMAHLLEHLLFRGSTRHPKLQEEFRKYGARVNGSTSVDRTNYFETFPASDENLRWALDLEADRMVNSFVAKADLDQEMTVVRNEFERGENEPGRILYQRTMASAFDWHNYGKSTIGSKADLENVPIERLKAFYAKYYQPDNAVLTVAGKIDEAKTLALVSEYFGKIPRPARKLERTYTLDPDQDGERTVTVRRVGDIQMLMTMYRTPDGAHPDAPALSVLATMLTTAPSGRLHKALIETKKAASVGGGFRQMKEPGVMMFSASVRKEGSLPDVKDTLLRVVHDLVKEPPTKEEVERAKSSELNQVENLLRDSDRLGLVLSEPIAGGDWRLLFRYRDMLKKVTPEDVLRVAKTYVKEDNRTIGMFIPVDKPDRAIIPPPTDLEATMRDFKVDTAVAQGEVFEATPENIEKRVQRSTLANGMKLVLLPKQTRGNSVNAVVRLSMGDLKTLSDRKRASVLAVMMLSRGTKTRTRQQIRDEMDRLRARMGPMLGGTGAGFSIETQRANLAATLTLGADLLRNPSFPAEEFEQLKQQWLAQAESRKSDPATIASNLIRSHLEPYPAGDPRHVLTSEEEIAELRATTLEDVKKFHAELFGGSMAELVIVGDHDPAEIKALAAKLFGDWKSPVKPERITRAYKKVEAINKSVETPDKANATFQAGMPLAMNEEHPDYPALTIANYIFGGGMSGRLFQRVRTKEGLSYGVGSSLSIREKDDAGQFSAYAIAAPQNMAKVEAVFKEELARAIKDGFTETEINEAKKGWLQSRTVSRSNDGSLASLLLNFEYWGRTMAWQSALEKKVAALTADQINSAFRKYIDPAQISYVKAGDFAKAATAPPAATR